MTQKQAMEIAYNWHYDREYSFYDMEADQEDLKEFIDPVKRGSSVYSVMNHHELIGYFTFTQTDAETYDIGLGLRPDLTGQGLGSAFLRSGISFGERSFNPKRLTLSVATFNQRAIKLYKNFGFKETDIFLQDTNGSTFEFFKMVYEY
ncbi:GNAT family N-acetyltransferase [Jeotgalibacillus proteolyticus]|uniref:GNAT family N-acetyltransferase n=1 Tax=Jeotgalibacillus proteolyticus TaxID=2082395 RepID=UPI003CEF7894